MRRVVITGLGLLSPLGCGVEVSWQRLTAGQLESQRLLVPRVLDVAPSKSKNDRGIVTVETKGFNQKGEEVCYFRRKVMVWKREFAPDRARPYDEQTAWT